MGKRREYVGDSLNKRYELSFMPTGDFEIRKWGNDLPVLKKWLADRLKKCKNPHFMGIWDDVEDRWVFREHGVPGEQKQWEVL